MRRRHLAALLALTLAACSGGDDEELTPPSGDGFVSLTVTAAGAGPQGTYVVVVDGTPSDSTLTRGRTTRLALPAGRHTIGLAGLPAHCAAASDSWDVSVSAGGTSALALEVACAGVSVRVRTGGQLLDADGYTVALDDDTTTVGTLPPTGSSTVAAAPGSRRVVLRGLASNCVATENPRTVDVVAARANPVDFQVRCIAGALRVELVTSGPDVDGNGYTVRLTAAGRDTVIRLAANEAQVAAVLPDAATVSAELGDVSPNCAADATTRVTTLTAPDTSTVRFTLTCTALPPAKLLLSVFNSVSNQLYTLAGGNLAAAGPGRDAVWAPGLARYAVRNATLELRDASGALLRTLPAGVSPVFSPDGSKLYYQYAGACVNCFPNQIQEIDLNDPASQPRTIFRGDMGAGLDVSPDGRRLVFVRDDYYSYGVIEWNLDGSGSRSLVTNTNASFSSDERPRYSPDGTAVLVNQFCASSNRCAWLVPLDGRPPYFLSSSEALGWSPDGTRILLNEGGQRLVTVRVPDGADRQVLLETLPGSVTSASWRR